MRILKIFSLLVVSLVLITSCKSSLSVSSDYDRTVDFSQYKTFGIYKAENKQEVINQLNRNRIDSAIKKALIAKGLTESENPDVWVNSLVNIESKESYSSNTSGSAMVAGGYYRPYMWRSPIVTGSAITQYNVDTYYEGSLMIDLIDAKTNNLIWHAVGNKEINKNWNENADEKILTYVTQMLEKFPPEDSF